MKPFDKNPKKLIKIELKDGYKKICVSSSVQTGWNLEIRKVGMDSQRPSPVHETRIFYFSSLSSEKNFLTWKIKNFPGKFLFHAQEQCFKRTWPKNGNLESSSIGGWNWHKIWTLSRIFSKTKKILLIFFWLNTLLNSMSIGLKSFIHCNHTIIYVHFNLNQHNSLQKNNIDNFINKF